MLDGYATRAGGAAKPTSINARLSRVVDRPLRHIIGGNNSSRSQCSYAVKNRTQLMAVCGGTHKLAVRVITYTDWSVLGISLAVAVLCVSYG